LRAAGRVLFEIPHFSDLHALVTGEQPLQIGVAHAACASLARRAQPVLTFIKRHAGASRIFATAKRNSLALGDARWLD
jgi:hypothetical protein